MIVSSKDLSYIWRKMLSELLVLIVGSLMVNNNPASCSAGLKNSLTSSMVLFSWTMESSSKYPGETTTITLSDAVNALSVSQESAGGQSIKTYSYMCLILSSSRFKRSSRWSLAAVNSTSVLERRI